jgi:hypothetical protein
MITKASTYLIILSIRYFLFDSGEIIPFRPLVEELFEPSHNIEVLELFRSHLDGRELWHFIPSHKSPLLNSLKFYRVEGLTEDDIMKFLTRVAPTLRSLYLEDCGFKYSREGLSCYPIDQAMPYFTVLQEMTILRCPKLFTAVSLRSKPTRIAGSRITSSEFVGYEQIVDALMESKWEFVQLKTDMRESYAEAKGVAENAGIIIHLSSD